MYSTCLFCNKALGNNEVLEAFPVGRRVAFDGAQGRLWAVCKACERWNLSPLDDRWEVIEECERLFAAERKRVSTENIGLAKLNEGLELVRIGKPMRPEFAAWRYGDQFGRRRRRNLVIGGMGAAAVGAIVIAGAVAGIGFYGIGQGGQFLFKRLVEGNPNEVLARPSRFEGAWELKRKHLKYLTLLPDEKGNYVLRVKRRTGYIVIEGDEARQTMSKVLPLINRYGAPPRSVQSAVSFIEYSKSADDFIKQTASNKAWPSQAIKSMPVPIRLALEMAVHEDAERRALEGELQELERAWKDAEEIAAISDSLLTPNIIQETIERFKRG
ncbi:MAG TPA: hypothetical protein VM100_09215 [Longimicrobiales bacterium]|nr:hypothetical protein [Longimicrobiales bacterium]